MWFPAASGAVLLLPALAAALKPSAAAAPFASFAEQQQLLALTSLQSLPVLLAVGAQLPCCLLLELLPQQLHLRQESLQFLLCSACFMASLFLCCCCLLQRFPMQHCSLLLVLPLAVCLPLSFFGLSQSCISSSLLSLKQRVLLTWKFVFFF